MTSGLLWRGPLGELSLSGTVVRREALQQLPQTLSVLTEAEAIRSNLEQTRQTANQLGYEHGLQRGRADAISHALHAIADAESLCKGLSNELTEIVSAGLDALLDESTRRAITDHSIRLALSQSEPAQRAELLVGPTNLNEAIELAVTCVGDPLPSWLTVRADPGLTEADVVFVADGKVLDCRLQTRLSQWRESLQHEVQVQLSSVLSKPGAQSSLAENEVASRDD